MKVDGTLVNGNTPCFVIQGKDTAPWGRAFGAVYTGSEWLAPAYFPLGLWALHDLRILDPQLQLNGDAWQYAMKLDEDKAAWDRAQVDFGAKVPVNNREPPDFFPGNFTPYSFQRFGMARVRLWWRSWFLWDMGTGKTRTMLDGLRLLAREGLFKKALVIGPPVVLSGWLTETKRVSGGAWKAVHWDGTPEAVEQAKTAQIVTASYARARMEAMMTIEHPLEGSVTIFSPERSRLLTLGYDTIIADESHNLGNIKSDQTKACLELSIPAARRYCLTGTPGADPGKIYGQLAFLSPRLLNLTWEKYQQRYFSFAEWNPAIVKGYQNLNELNAIVDSIATRLKKKECEGLGLPPLTAVDVPFRLGAVQRKRYNEIVEDMKVSLDPSVKADRGPAGTKSLAVLNRTVLNIPHLAVAINKLLQLVSGFIIEGKDETLCDACQNMVDCVEKQIKPYTKACTVMPNALKRKVLADFENPKFDMYKDLLETILDSDASNKVIVWCVFEQELDVLEKHLRSIKVGCVRLDGHTTNKVTEIARSLQEDKDIRVLIGNVSAGIGINLTAANYMIFYSLPWQSLKYWQAMDRYNRPGQTRAMTAYRMLTEEGSGAIDRCVLMALKSKDTVEATMSARIACVQCDQVERCALDGTKPFRENCKYKSAAEKVVAKVSVV